MNKDVKSVGVFLAIAGAIAFIYTMSPLSSIWKDDNPKLIQTVSYQVTRTYTTDWVTSYYYDIPQTQPTDKVEYTVNTTLKNEYGNITFTDYCSDDNVDSVKCARKNESWVIYNRLVELNKPCN